MKKNYLFFTIIIACVSLVNAQEVIDFEHLQYRTAEQLESQLGVSTENGADFYKMTYLATGSDGLPDTASGLVVIPDSELDNYPMVIYHHGTVPSPDVVPSNLNTDFAAYASFGARGFIVLAPDFLGLGTSRGFHPYVHRATQASATIEMLEAFSVWLENEDVRWNEQLFLTGYSQGGHAGMATHWELEANHSDRFEVTAAAHLSGPYSISGVMLDNMFSEENYLTIGYIPYVVLGYQEIYGDVYEELTDIFRPQFINDIEAFHRGEIDLITMNIRMLFTLNFICGFCTHPVQMFNPDFVNDMNADPDHPVRLILRDNDTYGWAPTTPTRLFYCNGDDQVPFENSILADSVMNANGAPDLSSHDFGNLDHGACATPAVTAAYDFFRSFLISSTGDSFVSQGDIHIFPNPTNGMITIEGIEIGDHNPVKVFDINGRLIHTSILNSNQLDLSFLKAGLYIIHFNSNRQSYSSRLIIN
ncbi:MAG: T9SS C-terminal target domain-containing protein [Saprospirales bacterium]|nr:MAG: T9SS C-terminal target domain-containing protein [Saprospirales bacterium]